MIETVFVVCFASALVALVLLFVVAYAEERRGALFLSRAQGALDLWALGVERRLAHAGRVLDHWPTYVAQVGYYSVHVTAVLVALLARAAEKRAHRVADFVSLKRSFIRRETKSDFLKAVQEHKDTLEIPKDIGNE